MNIKLKKEFTRRIKVILKLIEHVSSRISSFNFIFILSYKNNDGKYKYEHCYLLNDEKRYQKMEQECVYLFQEVMLQNLYIMAAQNCDNIVICVDNDDILEESAQLKLDNLYKVVNYNVVGSELFYNLEYKIDCRDNNRYFTYNARRFERLIPRSRNN